MFIATCTVYMCTLTAHSLPTVTFVCFLLLLLSSSPPTSAGCQPYSEVQENYTQFIPICQQTASSNCTCGNGQRVSHIGSIFTFSIIIVIHRFSANIVNTVLLVAIGLSWKWCNMHCLFAITCWRLIQWFYSALQKFHHNYYIILYRTPPYPR